jgi:hypothetical protein
MGEYLLRKNCEYSTRIKADSEEEALAKANDTPLDMWDSVAWSDIEIDEDASE